MDVAEALKRLRAFRKKVKAAEVASHEKFERDLNTFGLMKMPRQPNHIKIDGVSVWPASRESAGLRRAEIFLEALLKGN